MEREKKILEIAEQLLSLIKSGDRSMYTYAHGDDLRRVDIDGHVDLMAIAEWMYARML